MWGSPLLGIQAEAELRAVGYLRKHAGLGVREFP